MNYLATLAGQAQPKDDGLLRSAHDITGALKPILTSGHATFILVGGTRAADAWRGERGMRDALLPSIFTDHVHIGLLGEDEAIELMKTNVVGWNNDEGWIKTVYTA